MRSKVALLPVTYAPLAGTSVLLGLLSILLRACLLLGGPDFGVSLVRLCLLRGLVLCLLGSFGRFILLS